jgi:hypothetical protein
MCKAKKIRGDIKYLQPKGRTRCRKQSLGWRRGVGRGRSVMQIGGGKVIQSTHLKMIPRTSNKDGKPFMRISSVA